MKTWSLRNITLNFFNPGGLHCYPAYAPFSGKKKSSRDRASYWGGGIRREAAQSDARRLVPNHLAIDSPSIKHNMTERTTNPRALFRLTGGSIKIPLSIFPPWGEFLPPHIPNHGRGMGRVRVRNLLGRYWDAPILGAKSKPSGENFRK